MPTAYIDSSYVDVSKSESGSSDWTAEILMSDLKGIEGIPYQFMSNVDERIKKDSTSYTKIGRKFGEKIIGRMPLLFLTPCEPLFMDTSAADQKVMFGALMGDNTDMFNSGSVDLSSLLSSKSNGVRYYTAQFATAEYYKYLNFMLNSVAIYLGLGGEEVMIGGEPQKLSEAVWQNEVPDIFSSYFYQKTMGQQSLYFYCDSMDSVSESFTNDTTQSSLASQINGYSDQVKEIQFLLGGANTGLAGDMLGNIQKELSEGNNGGAIAGLLETIGELAVNSLTGSNSLFGKMVNDKSFGAVAAGGKIIFPEIWSDSQYSKSYSLDIKLRSPDHDSLSIYLNILKPYCKLLALTMPRAFRDIQSNDIDPNGYGSPFLVKAACKGLFNIDMGLITGLSVTKGASCAWNDDGLPTQIDITLDIKDLYNTLAMSGYANLSPNPFSTFDDMLGVTRNVAYQDFLANMAGLNVNEMLPFRTLKEKYYSLTTQINNIPSTIQTRFDQGIANFISKLSWLK